MSDTEMTEDDRAGSIRRVGTTDREDAGDAGPGETPEVVAADTKPAMKTWEIVLASVVGGCFLTIADVVFNENKAVTTKIAHFVGRYGGESWDSVWFETVAFAVLIALGLGLCFVFRPRNRPAAFAQGSSVIGVLVGMNIGAQAITAAGAQEMTIQGDVSYSVEEPRAFGPFGIGTLLTGRSSVDGKEVEVPFGVTLTCSQLKMIGRAEYCAVEGEEAATSLGVPEIGATRQIWIKQAAPR